MPKFFVQRQNFPAHLGAFCAMVFAESESDPPQFQDNPLKYGVVEHRLIKGRRSNGGLCLCDTRSSLAPPRKHA